jgi:hypothetical protein
MVFRLVSANQAAPKIGQALGMPTLGISPKFHGKFDSIEDACAAASDLGGDEELYRIVDAVTERYGIRRGKPFTSTRRLNDTGLGPSF